MLSQRKPILAFIAVFSCAVFLAGPALAQEKSIVLAAATSAKDSGLFDHLLPPFTLKTGITVNVVAVGTGQALDTARRGSRPLRLGLYRAKVSPLQCPLWVISGHSAISASLSLCPRKRTFGTVTELSAKGQWRK